MEELLLCGYGMENRALKQLGPLEESNRTTGVSTSIKIQIAFHPARQDRCSEICLWAEHVTVPIDNSFESSSGRADPKPENLERTKLEQNFGLANHRL
jgi:hypothetical protein